MSQDVTAVETVEGPEWRTLKGLEAPLRIWGEFHGDHFRTAGNRKEVTGEPVVMVRLWSEQRGTARYAETQGGRTVSLGGAATRFWAQAGAGETPAVEEAPSCSSHPAVTDRRGAHVEALAVPRCEPGVTYGVWDELAGGFTFAEDCAMNVANWAAEQLDQDPDGAMSVVAVCREHEEQPAAGCEDCNQEDPEGAPVDEGAAEVEESVRYFAEFESVKAAPGHQEMRLSIRARGEQDTAEYYALTYMPGWTTEGVCRAFGWSPVGGSLEYVSMGTERGEVARTMSSGTPGAMAARTAVREEILARFTVRLVCGAAGHHQAVFRLGRAYPIGWTYRVGYGKTAFFQAVTAGGALVCTAGVLTREEATEQLLAHDPAAPAANDALRAHVQELAGQNLGRTFLAARNGDLTALPDELTADAPITAAEARTRVDRTHGQAEEFEAFQGEGGRFLGWTFRCGRLHSARYGWITGRGTVAQSLEPYRSIAGNVLVHADRDDREAAERAAAARSLTGRKLADNRCVHNRYARTDVQGDPVFACTTKADGETFAVFTDEGIADVTDCAVVAANVAARFRAGELAGDADAEPPFWAKTCPEHAEEAAGRCAPCGQDTPDEDAEEGDDAPQAPADREAGPAFEEGDVIVCGDGVRRVVSGMAPAVTGEPARVIVQGGAEWIAGNCLRANRSDLQEAHSRASDAAARVRTGPNPTAPEWLAALDTLTEALAYLRTADPLCVLLREDGARKAVLSVHPDAHMFVPFQRPGEEEPAGWSFRTGYSAAARYGVVTPAGQIAATGLYEYRSTAERAHLYGQPATTDGS